MADTNVFKPKGDAKNEATTKTARAIIDSEAAARVAKTARLRKARTRYTRIYALWAAVRGVRGQ